MRGGERDEYGIAGSDHRYGERQSEGRGSPTNVDRELVVLFMLFEQLKGKDAGSFYSINGYIFGELTGLVVKQGERVLLL